MRSGGGGASVFANRRLSLKLSSLDRMKTQNDIIDGHVSRSLVSCDRNFSYICSAGN